MEYLSIDIETTGLSVEHDDILEVGVVFDDLKTPVAELKTLRVLCPQEFYCMTPYIWRMHEKLLKELEELSVEDEGVHVIEDGLMYCQQEYIFSAIGSWLVEQELWRDCWTVAGKNFGAFDLQFLASKCEDWYNVRFHHRFIDPGSMYLMAEHDEVPGTQGCCDIAEVELVDAHSAVADALTVVRLIRYQLGVDE